jgi:hypothetical protein
MHRPRTWILPILAAALAAGACRDATQSLPFEPTKPLLNSASTAPDVECVGFFPPGTYGNVTVPPGAFCFLMNSVVHGNVKALQDSRLLMNQDEVHGNVEGDKADQVQVFASTVGGSIVAKEAVASDAVVFIERTQVRENIIVEKLAGPFLIVDASTTEVGNIQITENVVERLFFVRINNVAQNLQVFKNTGPAMKQVLGNIVSQSIQCFENDPPLLGGPNTAPKKEGQCF